jgi:hypothetical protein
MPAAQLVLTPTPLLVCPCRDEPGASGSDAYEVCVNEEVVIPLAPAVRTPPLVVRKKDEVRPLSFASM